MNLLAGNIQPFSTIGYTAMYAEVNEKGRENSRWIQRPRLPDQGEPSK